MTAGRTSTPETLRPQPTPDLIEDTAFQQRWPRFDPWVEGIPVVLVRNRKALSERLKMAQVDIQRAAREFYGVGSLQEIDYPVSKPSWKIIPVDGAGQG